MSDELRGAGDAPILRVEGVRKTYVRRHPLAARAQTGVALEGVNLEIPPGCFLALVGESGSGKSTLARCIACLEQPSFGSIWFHDTDLVKLGENELRRIRPRLQMIFQDAATALNPRLRALDLVEEPLRIQELGTTASRRERTLEAMAQVGLPSNCADRLPHQFSAGQRQRLAIARALVQQPEILLLDEAVSGLDLSLQAQVLNLLLELRRQQGLTYLYISHDLSMVRRVADEIAVMAGGRIVERGLARDLFRSPQHAATRGLIAAIAELTFQRAATGSE